jgi:small subunit ribosomal protein S18
MKQIQKKCYFCSAKQRFVDYKDVGVLKKIGVTFFAKIKPKKYTGVCLSHQKKMASAIKKSRFMGLLPFSK